MDPVDSSLPWEGFLYSLNVSIFTKEGNLNKVFSKVGESSLWGLTIPSEDERICNDYGNCTMPLYKYIFSTLGVCFPFTTFEISVLNYLKEVPSQLHPIS